MSGSVASLCCQCQHLGYTRLVTSPTRPRRKKAGQYHHGDLRAALLGEALRTIQTSGIEQLTLRTVGERLGVSRTALYRHFSSKQALLVAVGREGFRMLRMVLTDALDAGGGGPAGFEAMGLAYVRFAVAHPAHYRVMFGGFIESCSKDLDFVQEATATFQVLQTALTGLQQAGIVRRDDPHLQSLFVWSMVHGVSMLAIDGQLGDAEQGSVTLGAYATGRLRDALRATAPPAEVRK